MLNPGDYTLAASPVTAAGSTTFTPITDLEGAEAITLECQFSYVSGGTTFKVWVQTTLDGGVTWIDIACFAFTTAGAIKVVNLSGLTPVTTAITPTDGTMADNTVQDGVLGSAYRAKLTSTGTYASGTAVAVRMNAR